MAKYSYTQMCSQDVLVFYLSEAMIDGYVLHYPIIKIVLYLLVNLAGTTEFFLSKDI